MNESRNCPICDTPLPADAPQGLCPACLFGQAIKVQSPESRVQSQLGRCFGDYELLGEIAQGGMGVVYYARQISLNRTVALKMIRSGQLATAAEVERFHTEAKAAANLDHPNIVPLHEIGELEGQHYFSMKLMEGGTLAELSAECRVRSAEWLRRAARLVATIAHAAHHAHQRGVLHRDIKPTNILLDEHGEPHLTDFGLAKLVENRPNVTQSLAVLGTPGYMSPEQASGRNKQLTTAADIYSLGAILFELLTGQPPFKGDSALEILKQVQEQEPTRPQKLNPRVERDLETICLKCLAKQPEARYATAQALAEDLERFLRDEPIQARPARVVEKIGRWCRRKPALAAALGGLALALLTGLGGVVWQWRRADANAQSEAHHRKRAEEAVFRLTFEKAETLFEQDRTPNALAYLARLLHENPTNEIIAARIQSAIGLRGFCLPVAVLRHSNLVSTVQFSPDGRRLLTASRDGTARVWNADDGAMLAELKHGGVLYLASWSPDGRRVLTASTEKSARVWDVGTNLGPDATPFLRLGEPFTHNGAVETADFSPQGDRVITGSPDKTARIWDARTGQPVTGLLVHTGAVRWVKFSPDGERVATVSAGRVRSWEAQIWSARTGQREGQPFKNQQGTPTAVFTPDGNELLLGNRKFFDAKTGQVLRSLAMATDENVFTTEFSADGRRLLTGAGDFTARIWDCATGQPLSPAMHHDNYVIHASWSLDERRIVTASRDNTVRIWDARGQPVSELMRHPTPVAFGSFNSNGTRLVTRALGNEAWVWQPRSRLLALPRFRHEDAVISMRFSGDGRRLLTTSQDLTARCWDVETGRACFAPLQHLAWVDCAQFSPDGKVIVTAAQDGRARLWDATTGRPSGPVFQHKDHVRWAEFSPDGRWLLTASFDSTAQVWDARSGQPVGKRIQHASRVQHAHFSPDGRRVVTASSDGTGRVWDAATGEPVSAPMRHSQALTNARFTPDGRRVVTTSWDRTARAWDAATGQPLTPPVTHSDELQRASPDFHPDGRRVVTAGGNSALIWDLTSGKPLVEPLQHSALVRAAVFSSDGRLVATASADRKVRIWDVATGLPLSDALVHEDEVFAVEFSPDSRWLATGSRDGSVILWEAPRAKEPPPAWLSELAVAAGGLRLNADGMLDAVATQELLQLRQRLEGLTGSDAWSVWARWFCADPATRQFWPSFPSNPARWGKLSPELSSQR